MKELRCDGCDGKVGLGTASPNQQLELTEPNNCGVGGISSVTTPSETIQIPKEYIKRLKYYTEQVENSASYKEGPSHTLAVVALLGYLEALETLV